MDASNGGVEALNGAVEGSKKIDQWSQIRISLMMRRLRIRIWIRTYE